MVKNTFKHTRFLAVSIRIFKNLTFLAVHIYELIWHWCVVAQWPSGFTINTGICITNKSVLFYHMTLEVSSVGEGSVADMTIVLFPLGCMWDAGAVLKGLMTIKGSFCFTLMIENFELSV